MPWIKCWPESSVFGPAVKGIVVVGDTRDKREIQERNRGWEGERGIVN